MMQFTEANFKLNSIEIKSGLVKIKGYQDIPGGGVSEQMKINGSCTIAPHPDLTDCFAGQVNDWVITLLGLMQFEVLKSHCTEDQKMAYMKLQVPFQKLHDYYHDAIKVTKFTFTGKEKTAGVVIEGTRKVDGQITDFKTRSVTLSASSYGFEENLEQLCETIESEVFEYHFNQKKSQQEIEHQDEAPIEGMDSEEDDND